MGRLFKFVLDKPWMIISFLFLITLIFAVFILQIQFDADMTNMIPEDDPVIKSLVDASEEFGSQDFFMIALRSNNIFSALTLEKIAAISKQIEQLAGVKNVTSPLNVDLIESDFLGIKITPAAEKIPRSKAEIAEFKARIMSSPYLGKLITEDGKAAAILVKIKSYGDISQNVLTQVTGQVEKIVNSYQGQEEIFIIGEGYTAYYAERAMKRDIFLLLPLIIIVLLIILYWSFHSLRGIMLPLTTVLISVIWTVGLMAIMGIPLTIVTMVMPIILLAIGSADGIHILNKYYEALAAGLDKREALEETMEEMVGPVVMTSLTTAAGFAALITSFITPIKMFGVFTSIGVLVAMFFSLLFIPAALILQRKPAHFKQEVREHKRWLVNGLSVTGNFMARRAGMVLLISSFILIGFLSGGIRLKTEGNMLNYFADDSPIIKGTNIVEEKFGGTLQVTLIFDTGKKDGLKEPWVLNEMLKTEKYLNSLPHVSGASSIADLICEINQALEMGAEDKYRIPDSRQAVAQELLLFNMQGGDNLDNLVNYNYDKGLITARIENNGSENIKAMINQIEDYLDLHYGKRDELKVTMVGTPKVIYRIMDRFVSSQMYSLVVSIVAVAFIVSLLLGSWLSGMISILPLILTVGINFGVMGYADIPLDAVTTMIASIAIGIGVDYSIHYISRYRKETRRGESKAEAITITGRTVGRGIFFNALTLILGFAILIFSQFKAVNVFGYLIALTMIISSAASLTIVPALLKLLPASLVLQNKSRATLKKISKFAEEEN